MTTAEIVNIAMEGAMNVARIGQEEIERLKREHVELVDSIEIDLRFAEQARGEIRALREEIAELKVENKRLRKRLKKALK
jgi:hypothetical protein